MIKNLADTCNPNHASCSKQKKKKRRCGMIANETTSTRDQMTQKLTTIGHHTAFNNEQSTYSIVSFKRPQNEKCFTIQTRKSSFHFAHLKGKK